MILTIGSHAISSVNAAGDTPKPPLSLIRLGVDLWVREHFFGIDFISQLDRVETVPTVRV